MWSVLGSLSLGYLVVTGTPTAAAVMGRGLAHAARQAFDGDLEGAATAVLSAVTAPAVLAGAALAGLVGDVLTGPRGWPRTPSAAAAGAWPAAPPRSRPGYRNPVVRCGPRAAPGQPSLL